LDISIVIPAFNSENTIAQTIEACLQQQYTHGNIEVIIVDDGSTDNTKRIVENYPVRYIFQQNNGPAKARNTGWKEAQGDIICFTDSDCIPHHDWVQKLTTNLSGEDIGAVGGSYSIVNEEFCLAACIHQEILIRHERMSQKVKALGSYNLSVPKKLLEKMGGFNEAYTQASGEDNDLCYRLIKAGYSLYFEKDALVSHHHPNSFTPYLRHQFWHGYWRAKLYQDHPDMMRGDDYSGLFDYIQTPWFLFTLCLIPFAWISPIHIILLAFSITGLIFQFPLTAKITARKRQSKYLMLIPVNFFRGLARSLGMALGIWRFWIGHKHKKIKDKTFECRQIS
jgi:glycosyltransferase involved in cell wall biosynthesis